MGFCFYWLFSLCHLQTLAHGKNCFKTAYSKFCIRIFFKFGFLWASRWQYHPDIIDCHRLLLKTDNNRCYRKIANFPAMDYRFYRLITPGNTHDATFYLKGLFASASCLQNSDDLTDVVLISVSKRFFHSLILSKYLFDKDSATLLQRYIILQQR